MKPLMVDVGDGVRIPGIRKELIDACTIQGVVATDDDVGDGCYTFLSIKDLEGSQIKIRMNDTEEWVDFQSVDLLLRGGAERRNLVRFSELVIEVLGWNNRKGR